MRLTLVAAAAMDPITLQEVKDHLRITDDDTQRDADLASKIPAAVRIVETRTGPLLSQQWELWADAFPELSYLEIAKRPLLSIDEVSYFDADDAETVLDPADYYYTDLLRGRILLRSELTEWPTDLRGYHAVRVQFTAGYGEAPAAIPPDLIEAVKQVTAYLYMDPEGLSPFPPRVQEILASYEPVAV
jgi:uncharacterized phiE125 gp8 family phage protein